jgi:hypothetical protein
LGDTADFLAISRESSLCALSKKLEATGDGCTATTSMPMGRTSTAREAANWVTKLLVAPYITAKGLGMYPETDEV